MVDIEAIHKDILSTLPSDPSIASFLSNPIPVDSCWSRNADSLLRLDKCIYVPNSNDPRLCVLVHRLCLRQGPLPQAVRLAEATSDSQMPVEFHFDGLH